MSTPFVTSFTVIGDAPMEPSRKKARHEYFVIGQGPIDKILFPELDDHVTPLHMKKFPSIRPRRTTALHKKVDEYHNNNDPTTSSVVPFPFLEEDLPIRNPMLQLTMSTMYHEQQQQQQPIKLRQRRSDDERTWNTDYARSS
jgi:hypothetical protein